MTAVWMTRQDVGRRTYLGSMQLAEIGEVVDGAEVYVCVGME
jgi:hypothetical protein